MEEKDNRRKTRIVINTSERVHQQLKEAAAEAGVSMSAFVNLAINEALRKEKRKSPK